jgi:hypothetical protein
VITKRKAYAATVAAALAALGAALAPNTPAALIIAGILSILAGLGVYQVPYQRPPTDPPGM